MRVALKFEGKTWTPLMRTRARLAAKVIEKVAASIELKDAFQKFTFPYQYRTRWWGRWRWTQSRLMADGDNNFSIPPMDAYERLMSGAEELSPERDGEIDITLRVEATDLVGYTYPDVVWQVVGSWVFDEYDVFELANNLAHEWAHKAGFDHSFRRHVYWPASVPYFFGDRIEQIGRLIVTPKNLAEWKAEIEREQAGT